MSLSKKKAVEIKIRKEKRINPEAAVGVGLRALQRFKQKRNMVKCSAGTSPEGHKGGEDSNLEGAGQLQ